MVVTILIVVVALAALLTLLNIDPNDAARRRKAADSRTHADGGDAGVADMGGSSADCGADAGGDGGGGCD